MPLFRKLDRVGCEFLFVYIINKLCDMVESDFMIFTAARSGEVRGAAWTEIHGDVWKVPGERMKAEVEHRVHLNAPALEVLEQARALDDGSALVFPSPIRRGARSPT